MAEGSTSVVRSAAAHLMLAVAVEESRIGMDKGQDLPIDRWDLRREFLLAHRTPVLHSG